MAHGAPDWGAFKPGTTVYSLSDMAELAARLGSPVTFDRRGEVMWMDDFEGSVNKWVDSLDGVGSAAELSDDHVYNGAKSLKITTGAAVGSETQVTRGVGPHILTTQLGAEVSFMIHRHTRFDLVMQALRSGITTSTGVRYDPTLEKLQLITTEGAWTDLITDFVLSDQDVWHTIKLVSDLTGDGHYVRLILNERTPAIAHIPPGKGESITEDYLLIWMTVKNQLITSHSMYFGDFILTQNEP